MENIYEANTEELAIPELHVYTLGEMLGISWWHILLFCGGLFLILFLRSLNKELDKKNEERKKFEWQKEFEKEWEEKNRK